MAFGVLRGVFATQELGLLAGLMAERGLRLRQEALEGWDESGAEESDDDSDGGEGEIEQREEEYHTRLILIESECGLALLFLCPRQQRPVQCEDIDFSVLIVSIIYRSVVFSFFFCKIQLSCCSIRNFLYSTADSVLHFPRHARYPHLQPCSFIWGMARCRLWRCSHNNFMRQRWWNKEPLWCEVSNPLELKVRRSRL